MFVFVGERFGHSSRGEDAVQLGVFVQPRRKQLSEATQAAVVTRRATNPTTHRSVCRHRRAQLGRVDDAGGLGLTILVGCAAILLLLFGLALLLRAQRSALWLLLSSDAKIADFLISISASIVGTGLTVLVAYAVLSEQLRSDRTVALDTHATEVAHEVAGAVVIWAEAMTAPRIGGSHEHAVDSHTRQVLVANSNLLAHYEIDAVLALAQRVATVTRIRASMIDAQVSITERLATAHLFTATLAVVREIEAEWFNRVGPEVRAIYSFARELAVWKPGDRAPQLAPRSELTVSTMVETENRLRAQGVAIERDRLAEALGLYESE